MRRRLHVGAPLPRGRLRLQAVDGGGQRYDGGTDACKAVGGTVTKKAFDVTRCVNELSNPRPIAAAALFLRECVRCAY